MFLVPAVLYDAAFTTRTSWGWLHCHFGYFANGFTVNISLLMALCGRPTPNLCFLSGRLRWTLLPKERYGNSLGGSRSNTQTSDWEADTSPLSYMLVFENPSAIKCYKPLSFNHWQGSHVVLNCEVGFQDLEKVLNLAKMYIPYWKSIEILNSAICLFFIADDSSADVLFASCSMIKIFEKWS